MLDKFLGQIITIEMKIKEMQYVQQNTLHLFLNSLKSRLTQFKNKIMAPNDIKSSNANGNEIKKNIHKKHLD